MTDTKNKNIRMGSPAARQNTRLLLFGGIGVLVVGVVVAVLILASGGETPVKKPGCDNDTQCGPGKICLKRGCVLLMGSEHRGIWHDDVKAQLDAGAAWEPRKAVGVKLSPMSACPARRGDVPPPRQDKMVEGAKIHLFEVRPSTVSHYQFLKVKGSVWIDAVRFYFPLKRAIKNQKICASAEVAAVATGVDANKRVYVDVSLSKASPAGVDAKAAVTVTRGAPKPDKTGKREIVFSLSPVFGEEKEFHTVLALPLGSDVLSINGPTPSEQRLQRGFVTYYWTHTAEPREVAVGYKIYDKSPYPLDFEDINP